MWFILQMFNVFFGNGKTKEKNITRKIKKKIHNNTKKVDNDIKRK